LARDCGSIAPYGLALLALVLTISFGLTAASHAALQANRVQNIADAAVLYAHDRASNEASLTVQVARFLSLAKAGEFKFEANRRGETSELKLCTRWRNPFAFGQPRELCRFAAARSFELVLGDSG
jgi:Flp pilus assembly protein TadG